MNRKVPYPDIRDAACLPAAAHHHHGLAAAVLVTGRGEGDLDQFLVAAVVGAAARFGVHVHRTGGGSCQCHVLRGVFCCLCVGGGRCGPVDSFVVDPPGSGWGRTG